MSFTKQEGNLPSDRELEALEQTLEFAKATGIDIGESRPCIAALYFDGLSAGCVGRKPAAFLLGLELKVCGISMPDIVTQLGEFNSRLDPPVAQSVLAQVVRSLEMEHNRYRYGCAKLQSWCIGADVCPWKKGNGASLSMCRKSSPSHFVTLGWPGYLKSGSIAVYLALAGIRTQRGLDPNSSFGFYFADLELRSGVSRSKLRKHLEALHQIGLIQGLEIGSAWNTGGRKRTRVSLTAPLPSPDSLGLIPLRWRERD